MNPTDFLKSKLDYLVNLFPTSRFQYEYNQFAGFHIVQVSPVSLYNGNKLYQEIENCISTQFDELFLPETLLFVTEGSLNTVSNPAYEIMGNMYGFEMFNLDNPLVLNFRSEAPYCTSYDYALAA